ncbi:MAG: hypothetical protein M1814_000470 [Vezdaea aestivalis]|nr:MAG: hypothetical protein M1814_000470 [Vezdaea aestivalis]
MQGYEGKQQFRKHFQPNQQSSIERKTPCPPLCPQEADSSRPPIFSNPNPEPLIQLETTTPPSDPPASHMPDPRIAQRKDSSSSQHYSSQSNQGNPGGSPQKPIVRENSPRRRRFESEIPPPPITLSILAELDLGRIMQNHQLRHDVNFDLNLHFRPNNDREKGDDKVKKIKCFWQITEVAFNDAADWNCPEALQHIQTIFETIREILKSLVPDTDHGAIDDRLDVPLLLQQLEKTQLNFPQLAHWLSNLLRTHCAPMRDAMVMDMVQLVEFGALTGDTNYLVQGLKELFGILECMKLDIANHQIRSLQPLLLEETVSFEQKSYARQMKMGKCIWKDIAEWHHDRMTYLLGQYSPAQLGFGRIESQAGEKMSEFFWTFTHTICWRDEGKDLPDSAFGFDMQRVKVIRNEINDLVFLQQSVDFYRRHTQTYTSEKENESVQRIRSLLGSQESPSVNGNRLVHDISSVCLEVARQNPKLCSAEEVQSYERMLERLTRDNGRLQRVIYQDLLQKMFQYAEKYDLLSPGAILASWNPVEMKRVCSHYEYVLHDLARRIAHMGILHWKVWGPRAYTVSLGDLNDVFEEDGDF